MRRILIFTTVFLLMVVSVLARTIIITDPPPDLPFYVMIKTPESSGMEWYSPADISFEAVADSGEPPYTYEWSFCNGNDCNPTTAIGSRPSSTFVEPGTYNVVVEATDGSGTTATDSVSVVIKMADIAFPIDDYGFGVNESIGFEGNVTNPDYIGAVTYEWDFGDGAPVDTGRIVSHEYTISGNYQVTLTVSNSTESYSDTDSITIFVVDPVVRNISCYASAVGCQGSEKEVLKLQGWDTGYHLYSFDSSKNFQYTICCSLASVNPALTSDSSGTAVYATLLDDTDARIGGAHAGYPSSSVVKYYELTSNVGAGTRCEQVYIGENGNCSVNNMTCVYEYYPRDDESTSHAAPCTADAEPNTYPYAMCCQIAEDCTNNLDDNYNDYADSSDNHPDDLAKGSVCGVGEVCGLSDTFKFEECSWMSNYCSDEDNTICDFTELGIPGGYSLFFAEWSVSDPATGCVYGLDSSGTVSIVSGDNCVSVDDWLARYSDLQSTADSISINVLELYNHCRFWHCSKGQDEYTNPLPAYVEDMENDANLTRHVCTIGYYWGYDETDGWGCLEFSECYNPTDPQSKECTYDYRTQFSNWTGEAMPFDPDADLDCFDSEAGWNEAACCPIYAHGQDTYDMVGVEYYVQ